MSAVDPNKVIKQLAIRLADTQIELAMTQVALEDANAKLAKGEVSDATPGKA